MIDVILVSSYLLAVLLVGIYHSRGIKSMSDFSSANKSFSGPVIMATISATFFGAEFVFGIAEKAYSVGIVFFFVLLACSACKCILASYVVPRVARFSNAISVGDIMEKNYGTIGRVTTGLSGAVLAIGFIGAQIAACAELFQYFFDIPQALGVIIGCGIVVVYSAFGGFKAVTFTDVLQFAVLIVVIPLVCNIELSQIGGYGKLFELIPRGHIVPSREILFEYAIWFIVFLIPFLDPALMQRMLMDRDTKKVVHAWRISALVDIPFYILVCTIGLIALVHNPNLTPGMAFTEIIGHLPPGISGAAIAGILAIIMSNADSYLNVASISLVHDVIKPLTKRAISDKMELLLAQILTVVLGIFAIFAALNFPSLLDLIIYAYTLSWVPLVVVPLYAVIFGFKVGVRPFIVAGICGLGVQFIWPRLTGIDSAITLPIVSLLASALGLIISHYVFQKRLPSFNLSLISLPTWKLPRLGWPRHLFSKLIKVSTRRVNSFGASYTLFGLFAVLNYIVPYFMWSSSHASHFNVHLGMRFFAASLCFALLMNDFWPKSFRKILPVYWYFTLLYCLPFSVTFMLLDNNCSEYWIYNFVLALFLLAALVDWMTFTILLIAGAILGYGFYICIGGDPKIALDETTLYSAIYMYVFAAMIGILFSRKNEQIALEKMGALKVLSAAIAHEMRTPLATISIGAENIVKYFPTYIEGYEMAKNAGLPVKSIKPNDRKLLEGIPQNIEKVSKNTQNVINMLLMKVKDMPESLPGNHCMLSCLQEAIEQYPLSVEERRKIHLIADNNFSFFGDNELFVHVIFNLIKNSLPQISFNNGKISIWMDETKEHCRLHFSDNGEGIPSHILPKVFDRFVTGTEYGTGLGLAYCKMVMKGFGGDILCNYSKDAGTEFVMIFPKIAEKDLLG